MLQAMTHFFLLFKLHLTKYGLVGNDLIPLPGTCYIKQLLRSQDIDNVLLCKLKPGIQSTVRNVLYTVRPWQKHVTCLILPNMVLLEAPHFNRTLI